MEDSMNKKRFLFLLTLCLCLFALSACGKTYDLTGDGSIGRYVFYSDSEIDGLYDYGEYMEITSEKATSSTSETEESAEREIVAGQITCFEWNDNEHYADYRLLFQKGQETDGKWLERVNKGDLWGFTSLNRIRVTVLCEEEKVPNVKLTAESESGETYTAVTDNAGVAYLFPSFTEGTITVFAAGGEAIGEGTFDEDNKDVVVQTSEGKKKSNLLEIMFVIDATGSMGDEMEYLQAELADVIQTIASRTNADVNLAFLFYRDDGDDEKFAYSDFVDIKDKTGYDKQQQFLKSKEATGGGDYEEAVDEALALATEKQWSGGTKLIFHLHDAPPHSAEKNKTTYKKAVDAATEKGIRICPILASSSDALTEYLARQSAITTGGTSIYITDHSGIGGSHLDPEIPDVTVEKLNACLVRVVEGFFYGSFAEPVSIFEDKQAQ